MNAASFKKRYAIYLLLFLMYSVFGIYFIDFISKRLTEEHFNELGDSALNMAKILANGFEITDEEVKELKTIKFDALEEHPVNKRLSKYFESSTFGEKLKYIYVIHKLEYSEVKYYVTPETSEFYGHLPGVPLNYMWLIDVDINDNMDDDELGYSKDENRYSYLRNDESIEFFEKKEPMFCLIEDEYGLAITGFAPVYSKEGTFVGGLGVDVDFGAFENYVGLIETYLMIVFLLPSIVLSVIFVWLYFKENRISSKVAETDALTALKNRRYMDKKLPALLRAHCRKGECFSVIMIDIDCFKKYNDNYGHLKGDEVLAKVSGAIQSVLRKETDIVCRYGGEEIIVLLSNTTSPSAVIVAGKIQSAMRALAIPHAYSDASYIVSVSQGIYSNVPNDWNPAAVNSFIQAADEALYSAKKTGRDKYVVSAGSRA